MVRSLRRGADGVASQVSSCLHMVWLSTPRALSMWRIPGITASSSYPVTARPWLYGMRRRVMLILSTDQKGSLSGIGGYTLPTPMASGYGDVSCAMGHCMSVARLFWETD